MKLLHYLFFICFALPVFAGFQKGTLVKTEHSYVPIEQLCVGDTVQCCADGSINKVVEKKKYSAENAIFIILENGNQIISDAEQKFYLPRESKWQSAKNLTSCHVLINAQSEFVRIQNIYELENSVELYDICIDNCHQFFAGQDSILVHNFIPIAIGLTFVFGGSAIEFAGVTIGIAAVGGLIGYKFLSDRDKKKNNIYFRPSALGLDTIPEIASHSSLSYHSSNATNKSPGAQAPGMPTEKDGYVPPKKWNGEKVKHPKTGQYGYPDKNGNVWVPTGPGPLAHGGPHWDVISKDGKRYWNIVPGGRIRGEK